MPLRPYQKDAAQAIHDHWKQGISRQLVVMATGLGKTVVAAHVPELVGLRHSRKRGLFLVHRDELAYQAAKQFAKHNPDLTVGVEKAQYRAGDADIVVASVQTLSKGIKALGEEQDCEWEYGSRIQQFRPEDFAFVITDESHHAAHSASYHNIYRYFRCLKGRPEEYDNSKLFLGITATPNRSDNIGLEVLFDKISYSYGIREGVNDGWLTRIICHRIETEVDISQVHTTAGDFNVGELQATVNTRERNELIAQEYIRRRDAGDLEGASFFFTVDIAHAHDLSDVLRGHGIKVYPISSKTPEDECQRFMRLINEGGIEGLASAGKLNEGVDAPRVANAWMCRPCKSNLLVQQMVGRVLRPFPAPEEREGYTGWIKERANVIDFVDISGKHSLVTVPSLFGLRQKFDTKGGDILQQVEEIEKLEAENPGLDLREEMDIDALRAKIARLKTSRQLVDLLKPPETPEELRRLSKFTWIKQSEGAYHLGLMDSSMLSIHENTLGQCEVYKHVRGIRTKLYLAHSLPEAVAMAEREIPERDKQVMKADASWKKEPPTEPQCRRLWMAKRYDRNFTAEFPTPTKLFEFAKVRFAGGDSTFSRGGMSRQIDATNVSGGQNLYPVRR